jgi:hypothetical protein
MALSYKKSGNKPIPVEVTGDKDRIIEPLNKFLFVCINMVTLAQIK